MKIIVFKNGRWHVSDTEASFEKLEDAKKYVQEKFGATKKWIRRKFNTPTERGVVSFFATFDHG